jgi:hypothetical protein
MIWSLEPPLFKKINEVDEIIWSLEPRRNSWNGYVTMVWSLEPPLFKQIDEVDEMIMSQWFGA